MAMQSMKARVKNGRLVMDEPTDLPEGAEVELELVPLDDGGDWPSQEELERMIEESDRDIAEGKTVDGFKFMAELRAKNEARIKSPSYQRDRKSK